MGEAVKKTHLDIATEESMNKLIVEEVVRKTLSDISIDESMNKLIWGAGGPSRTSRIVEEAVETCSKVRKQSCR